MKEFKCRCSSIGDIMTNARGEGLSKTTESFVKEWMKSELYDSVRFFGNKYTEKGNEVEEDAIRYLELNRDYGFLTKNEESFENDFITGTPDLLFLDRIIDIKSSWDMWTFPLLEDELPEKKYYWQVQGYMALTDTTKATIAYVLMNTPDHLLNQWTDVPYDYNDLDSNLRIKEFEVERNDDDIQKIYDRVELIREYVKEKNEKIYKFNGV